MTEPKISWTTEELQKDFTVVAFLAPWVEVRRKADGIVGTMDFSGKPRMYCNFVPLNT